MTPIVMAVLLIAVSLVSATAGWVLRDAWGRGLPMRKGADLGSDLDPGVAAAPSPLSPRPPAPGSRPETFHRA